MNDVTAAPRRFTPDAQLDNWFGYHPPVTSEVGRIHDSIRAAFRDMTKMLQLVLPEGPDKTVAFRKVQEAMWAANACLACGATENYNPGAGVY